MSIFRFKVSSSARVEKSIKRLIEADCKNITNRINPIYLKNQLSRFSTTSNRPVCSFARHIAVNEGGL